MRTRMLGDLEVSEVGLGCNNLGWRLDEAESARVVHAALDAGITLFDTADVYGPAMDGGVMTGEVSEAYLGKAILSSGRRDDAVIATKFGAPIAGDESRSGASARWINQAVDDSLRRLGVDHIDLYQLHRPDPEVPIEETIGALHGLVTAGKVRAIGHSNFTAEMIDEAAKAAASAGATPFCSAQNHYSLLWRDVEDDVLPACDRHDLGMLPYFPLASGMLTGKITREQGAPKGTRLGDAPKERTGLFVNDAMFDKVEKLTAWAAERDHTLLDLAFAYLLAQPSVASVIAGATKVEQITGNVAAAQWQLSDAEVDEIRALVAPAA